MNLNRSADREEVLAKVLSENGFRTGEVVRLSEKIAFDPELAKEIVYCGAIAPYIFTMAKEKYSNKSLVCSTHPDRPSEGAYMNTQYCGECLDKNVWLAA